MPKFLVALVSGALTGVIGFMLGAIFTVPQNKEMEELVNAKAEMTQRIQVIKTEKKRLVENDKQLKKQVADLKDKLLKAYDIEKETNVF